MPRNYVPKPGAKTYKKYDELLIKQALDEIKSTKNSLNYVAEKYNISKSVLCRHKNRVMKAHGRPTALSKEEELHIVKNLNICGDWGYPLDTTDLRYIIKMYLDSLNINHKIFKNNFPGIDYIDGFLKRHADKISQRICQNIKRSRAAVSPETIKEYFGQLEKSLENVPTPNIINYDETNLIDDPGCRKVIVRRGCKYPERIVNHSKGSISLMMSATADGELLPPYVVYKAGHLYDSWTMGGPDNTRYNRSSSGWFDGGTFEDWIKTIVIPFFDKKDGKKILIGDNLSSHISIHVIEECKKSNVHFVFLPANSTHLTQPLDVAFFRPMKMIWRNLLDKWKRSDDGRAKSCVPKGCFPRLLKLLLSEVRVNAEKNVKSGFRKCGIVPLDANEVLARLPLQEEEADEEKLTAVNESFMKFLKEMRYGSMNIKEPTKKRKLEIVAGKSVSAEDLQMNQDQESGTSKKKRTCKQKEELETQKAENEKNMSIKGKGIGKKTKPKTERNGSETQDSDSIKQYQSKENIQDGINCREIEENIQREQDLLKTKGDSRTEEERTKKNEAIIFDTVNDPNVVVPELFDFDIESMPIIFDEKLDYQEVIVQTDSQEKKQKESKQNCDKENNPQVKKRNNPDIKIISDIKLKLPLPLKKTNKNLIILNSEKRNATRLKRERSLSIYTDTEEILKILEEE